MNFSIAKEKFSHLLYLTHSIVERRNTMPILANVKLTAENGKLSIAATDLEVSLLGEAEANVKTPGSTTVDAKVLYDIVREAPADTISLALGKGQRLEIQSGQSKFKINGTSADEFPSLSGTTITKPTSIDASMFYEMFDKTAFAVSTDETRYNINGVLVDTGAGSKQIRFVATDGHRLALIDRPSEGFSLSESVIIPRKGIQEIKKVLEGNEGAAKVEVTNGFFSVQSGDVTLGVRLVDGQFPDYRQVIPSENKTEVSVNRVDFLAAVRRVSLVTTDKNKAVRFRVADSTVTISSSSPEYGEASDSLAVEMTGDDVEIGFSARYIMDLLNAMSDSENITVRLNGDLGPGMFQGSGTEGYTCIVMPMRFE